MWLAVEWVGLIVKWVEFDGAVLGLMMHVHMYVLVISQLGGMLL